jgi:diamine N-acetyltransferase
VVQQIGQPTDVRSLRQSDDGCTTRISREEKSMDDAITVVTPPVVNVVGERVALGPFERSQGPTLQRWYNDFQVARTWVGAPQPRNAERIDAVLDWFTRDGCLLFAVYEHASWRCIGLTCLLDIEYPDRRAEFGILLGEADARGCGYGTEATRLTLDIAFAALGLHNVYLRVAEYNQAGRRAYEKAGFCEIGRRHECKFLNGRLWDVLLMECLATQFASPVLGRLLIPDPPR